VRKSIEQRLAAIAQRVRALSARDPRRKVLGSKPPAGHDHRPAKPISERAVREVEKRHGVPLPAAYRAFLRTVGDGGAGPGHGLLPLAKALTAQRRLGKAFPFGGDDARRVIDLSGANQGARPVLGDGTAVAGVLRLADDGSGTRTLLVITGPQRGKVWTASAQGYRPLYFARAGQPVQHTFLSWYEAWLRAAWRDTRPFEPPAGDRWNLNRKLVGELPEALFEQSHVIELGLAVNKLTSVPEAIGRLSALRKLDLSDNLLESLPESIGDLVQLEELSLARNRLAELPRGVCRLVNLRGLHLQQNPLRELPDTMGALRSLKRLSLGDTALRRLPRTLGTIPLEELQLNGVRLEDWRDLSTLATGGTLKHLWLSMNPGLEHIPDPVFDLGSLEYLVLGATPIREIPGDIGLLANLRLLGLAGTQVRALPQVLGELPLLKRVVLQNAPVPPEELARARAKWPHIEFEA
jgi:hypothetical protein